MNATEETFEDIAMDVPASGEDFFTIPPGMYPAKLVGLKVVPKPDWKLTGEEETDDQKNQIQWTFQIQGGDYDGVKLSDYTNISWHPKATAHKHAAALLGVPELAVGVGSSTRQLAGRTCQIWVVEKTNKKGDQRNYVEKVTPTPTPRMRPQTRSAAPQGTKAVGRVQLPDYPHDPVDGDDEEIEF